MRQRDWAKVLATELRAFAAELERPGYMQRIAEREPS